jgi:membrane protein YdbS with pleckstrin-like domain
MATPGPTIPPLNPSATSDAASTSGRPIDYLVPTPKLIRASLLSQGEQLLRETRATRLYFLPGPILLIAIFAFLWYSAAAVVYGWPWVPTLSQLISDTANANALVPKYIELLFALIAFLGFLWLLIRWVKWVRTVYAVTTSRVIIQRGILSRDFDEIPVNKVRAVEVHQGILQRLLGYGTVRVTSEGENRIANEAWLGIPKPWEFQRLINGAAEKYGR